MNSPNRDSSTREYNGRLIASGLPCACGEGSDNTGLYEDLNNGTKWLKCYNCSKNTKYTNEMANEMDNETATNGDYKEMVNNTIQSNITASDRNSKRNSNSSLIDKGEYLSIDSRKLSKDTCGAYKVSCSYYKDIPCIVFPYFNDNGQLIAQKLRFSNDYCKENPKQPKYVMLGDSKHIVNSLFGSQLWKHGGKKIVITEGEIDALSLAQVQDCKYPVVSLPSGVGSAKKALGANIDWLQENFEEIILMFDNDVPGMEAAEKAVSLFQPNKVKLAKLPLKDANEMLLQGKVRELVSSIFNASRFRPKGLVTIADIRGTIDDKPEAGLNYPWPSLTKLTFGLCTPSVNIWTGGTSQGKTTFLKSISTQLIKGNNEKVGIIFLEENAKKTVVDLASVYAGERFNSPLIEFDKSDRNEAFDGLSDYVVLNKVDSVNDWIDVYNKIRHLAVVEECKYIFLDHLTKFSDTAGGGNENSLMQDIMSCLSDIAMELDISINCISHVRKTGINQRSFEDGGDICLDDLKGSGAIKQYAWNVFAINRNKKELVEGLRNVNKVVLLKCRDAGENEGSYVYIRYNPDNGLLTEVPHEDIETDDDNIADIGASKKSVATQF